MMKKISQAELDVILEKHKRWLKGEKGGKKANLSYLDLSHTDLNNICLANANLCHVNLEYSNLNGANLRLSDLGYANLEHSDLSHVDLQLSNLKNVNLRRSKLTYGNLGRAFLKNADLRGADIRGVDFYSVILTGANLNGVITDDDTQGLHTACPEKGSFIGWKKTKTIVNGYVLVKLLIPEDAKRSSATTRKCRASKAKVLEMTLIETGERVSHAYSIRCPGLEYHTGEYVYPDSFDEDRWNECSNGIHFFMTKDEAIAY